MIIIVDGNNLTFRWLYGGQDDNKVAGFALKAVAEKVEEYDADTVLVVWDGGSDRRKDLYPEYKGTRGKTKEAMELEQVVDELPGASAEAIEKVNELTANLLGVAKSQLEDRKIILDRFKDVQTNLRMLFSSCGFLQCQIRGEEADDIIATAVNKLFAKDEIVILSSDHDFYSLLSERTSIWNWKSHYKLSDFKAQFGIEPSQWIDVKSLAGDSSDNIPGVAGIGIKKAVKAVVSGDYKNYESRADVQLYKQLVTFFAVDTSIISQSVDPGAFDRGKLLNASMFYKIGNIADIMLRLNNKQKCRRVKIARITEQLSKCNACEMRQQIQNTVVPYGNRDSDILIIGEAPGEEEDSSGVPFVGRAGQILEQWKERLGLGDNACMIANVVCCRPVAQGKYGVKNRKPTPTEIAFCSNMWLDKFVRAFMPKLIICLGDVAANWVVGAKIKVTKDFGRFVNERFGYPIITWVIPHPASVIYGGKTEDIIYSQLDELKIHLQETGVVAKDEVVNC